ncbi:hypothetical protein E8E11_002457 [Didymella keratinophila]|nr:hypothetical protein E8E11_002457 [Didymella keratinophila]
MAPHYVLPSFFCTRLPSCALIKVRGYEALLWPEAFDLPGRRSLSASRGQGYADQAPSPVIGSAYYIQNVDPHGSTSDPIVKDDSPCKRMEQGSSSSVASPPTAQACQPATGWKRLTYPADGAHLHLSLQGWLSMIGVLHAQHLSAPDRRGGSTTRDTTAQQSALGLCSGGCDLKIHYVCREMTPVPGYSDARERRLPRNVLFALV